LLAQSKQLSNDSANNPILPFPYEGKGYLRAPLSPSQGEIEPVRHASSFGGRGSSFIQGVTNHFVTLAR
jgi:hypothetical protein